MAVTELPELVPTGMLNEYAYCPQLFSLEWVDSLWASNTDVAEGERRHRRVDAGGGSAPGIRNAEMVATCPDSHPAFQRRLHCGFLTA